MFLMMADMFQIPVDCFNFQSRKPSNSVLFRHLWSKLFLLSTSTAE